MEEKALMPGFVTVAKLGDLAGRSGLTVQAAGRSLALFQVDGRIFALDAVCPHKGGPLGEGWVEEGKVFCPLHGWDFEIATGACASHPDKPAHCFETRVVEDLIQVKIDL
jgi:nitrite reductase (NADH) small subunit